MSRVVIIDYGSGNLKSAQKAFEYASKNLVSHTKIIISKDSREVLNANRIVLPGVGSFGDCLRGLSTLPGMLEALQEHVIERERPFMGICVGMQLLADYGMENGYTKGLGWLKGEVVPLRPSGEGLKIPHMGWNDLEFSENPPPIFAGLNTGDHAYFVHSYHFKCENPKEVFATVNHGGKISAIVGRNNILGTQFHPEKSQRLGLMLIENFLKWCP